MFSIVNESTLKLANAFSLIRIMSSPTNNVCKRDTGNIRNKVSTIPFSKVVAEVEPIIVTFCKETASCKQFSLNVMFAGNVTFCNEVHPDNTSVSSTVTCFGIRKVCRFFKPLKAPFPMLFTESGNVIETMFWLILLTDALKAFAPTPTTVIPSIFSGITISVSSPRYSMMV